MVALADKSAATESAVRSSLTRRIAVGAAFNAARVKTARAGYANLRKFRLNDPLRGGDVDAVVRQTVSKS